MFERYTDKARRVVFFARFEASQYGSACIETEHLLLGLVREDQPLLKIFLGNRNVGEDFRTKVEQHITRGQRISTSVEMPLTEECAKALKLASEEAQRLANAHVDTEHVLLGLMGVDGSLAARLLQEAGLNAATIREKVKTGFRETARAVERRREGGMLTLENFLAGIKSLHADELIEFFAEHAQFIDATGRHWNREEIFKNCEALLAQYAKKNSAAVVKTPLMDTDSFFVASLVWKNALLASEQRAWVHRMSVVLIREHEDWRIFLMHVTPVIS
jgi:ATP-dependent Clp protease ATP-binding subunit ClpA